MVLRVVLDTNIFVAAGFNPGSSSAKIIRLIRDGKVELVWDQATKAETKRVLNQIPRLAWGAFEDLFSAEWEFTGKTTTQNFRTVPDEDDRKFAALADAADATLVSNDDHLLSQRDLLDIQILTPSELVAELPGTSES